MERSSAANPTSGPTSVRLIRIRTRFCLVNGSDFWPANQWALLRITDFAVLNPASDLVGVETGDKWLECLRWSKHWMAVWNDY